MQTFLSVLTNPNFTRILCNVFNIVGWFVFAAGFSANDTRTMLTGLSLMAVVIYVRVDMIQRVRND